MTKHQYFNPESSKHQKFAEAVRDALTNEWAKTPELIEEITGSEHGSWEDWSSEWTRNVLYSFNNEEVLEEHFPELETKKEPGPGEDHIFWRLKE